MRLQKSVSRRHCLNLLLVGQGWTVVRSLPPACRGVMPGMEQNERSAAVWQRIASQARCRPFPGRGQHLRASHRTRLCPPLLLAEKALLTARLLQRAHSHQHRHRHADRIHRSHPGPLLRFPPAQTPSRNSTEKFYVGPLELPLSMASHQKCSNPCKYGPGSCGAKETGGSPRQKRLVAGCSSSPEPDSRY